jgi:hypothetical protein
MTNPDHTTIVTQWVRAGDLPEMRKGTSTPLDDPIWVSVGDVDLTDTFINAPGAPVVMFDPAESRVPQQPAQT